MVGQAEVVLELERIVRQKQERFDKRMVQHEGVEGDDKALEQASRQ